jgi:diguanylate cyclase (GGDEF)-like protein
LELDDRPESRVRSPVRLDSIKSRIVALALLATLVPALSTAVLSYVQNRRALTETLQGELQGIGSQAAREIDLWSKERFYDVRIFVSSFEVSENLERIPQGGPGANEALTRLSNYLGGVQGRFPDYAELLVMDADERPVASSRSELRAATIPEEARAALARGETALGAPHVDPDLGAVAVTIVQPITSADARPLGALLATLTFGAVEAVLEGFTPGDGGRIDLVTADGRAIAGSGGTRSLGPALPANTLGDLVAAGAGAHEFVGTDGTGTVGTLTRVPRLDWAVVTQIPSDVAYAQVAQLRRSTILLVSTLLVLVGVIAYVLGMFIVRPLDRLTAGAGAVARGDLSVDLPVTGGGEVAYLTEVFNGMVSRLRRSREELADANAALREHNVELEHLSMTDGLTGLYNRRYMMNELEKEVHRAERHGRNFSLLMLDVDRFKEYNDQHGHLSGDEVLTGMGGVIRDATREPDVPARYGGEEFIVLLPDCAIEGAVEAAHRIRARLAAEVFEGGRVTCSIGAAEFPTHGDGTGALIGAADEALYAAKAQGRDRVVAAGGARGASSQGADPAARRRSGMTAPAKKRAAKSKDGVEGGEKKRGGPKAKATDAD